MYYTSKNWNFARTPPFSMTKCKFEKHIDLKRTRAHVKTFHKQYNYEVSRNFGKT